MKKKLIGFLLILCLVIGLLPVTALADNTAKILILGSIELSVTEGGAPVYTKNKAFDAANTPDGASTFSAWTQEICDGTGTWNVKFEWPTGGTPTVTLKDAKFDYYDNDSELYAYIDKGGDFVSTANRTTQDLEGSTAEGTDYNLLVSAIMPVSGCNIDLKVVLKGNNLIETGSGFVLGNVAIKANSEEIDAQTYTNAYFKDLTFVGEDGNNTIANCDGIGIHTRSGYDVSFQDVNLTISTTAKGTNAIPIHVTKGNLTIDGGSIKVTQSDRAAIWTQNGGDIIINSGSVTATGSQGAGTTNGVIRSAGKLIINDGTVNATPQKAVGLYATNGIEVNGGTVEIITPYYGINAGGDIVFNGGTTTITAKNAFYANTNIIIGTDVEAYAGISAKKCQIYDGTNTKLAQKPWMLITNDPDKFIEFEEEDDDVPIFTPPTQTPTSPSVKPTKATESPRVTRPTEPIQNTEASQEPTQATKPSSDKVTEPATTPSVNDDPISTKPVATGTPEETVEETLSPSEAPASTEPSAPKATESTKKPGATKATEESKATEATTANKDKDTTKDKNNKDKNNDKDDNQKGPNVVLIIVLVVVVLAAAGGAAWFALKPKAAAAEDSSAPEEKAEE